MEFYKLFRRRTNFHEMLEWVDRGFRPDLWKAYDRRVQEMYEDLMVKPFRMINRLLSKTSSGYYLGG